LDQGKYGGHSLLLIWAFDLNRDFGALNGSEHHQRKNALSIDHFFMTDLDSALHATR